MCKGKQVLSRLMQIIICSYWLVKNTQYCTEKLSIDLLFFQILEFIVIFLCFKRISINFIIYLCFYASYEFLILFYSLFLYSDYLILNRVFITLKLPLSQTWQLIFSWYLIYFIVMLYCIYTVKMSFLTISTCK